MTTITIRHAGSDTRALAASILFAALASGCSCESMIGVTDDGGLEDAGPALDGAPSIDAMIDDGATDAGRACPGVGEALCGDACVRTQVDPANCGGCGVACAASQVCLSSGCTGACPAGLEACAGSCVDTSSDSAHCGSCGIACAANEGCLAGSCVPSVPVGPTPARCVGGGPPIAVGSPGAGICTGSVSAATFTRGLCACRDIGVPVLGDLYVDAYDSAAGPYVAGGLGGSVGANEDVNASGRVQVFGDLETTSAMGFVVRGNTTASGDLRVRTGLAVQNDLAVGGDAYVGGVVSGGSPADITGTLHTPSCAGVPASVMSAGCVSEAVTVEPPCGCEPTEVLPIDAIVAFYADPANHDDDELGLDPDALAEIGGTGARLDLPCGYYYLSRISAGGPTVIAVHGRTALFVGGSIEVGAQLTFALDPGSTLDVFVAGTIHGQSLRFGTPAYPAQSRIYVGGVCGGEGTTCSGDADCCSLDCTADLCTAGGTSPPFSVSLTSTSDLAGLFYAPNGLFVTSSALEMYGALFVGDYHSSSATAIHYDRASTVTGDDCPPPPIGLDAGVPSDASTPACVTGAPSCGPGLPACEAAYFCVTGCCTFFG